MNQQNQQPEEQNKVHRWDQELLKKGLKCDLEQLEMLKRCSEKKDITEWNEWLIKHPHEKIWLENAQLSTAYLEGADLSYANLKKICLFKAYLKKSNFFASHLENAELSFANLRKANLQDSRLQGTILRRSYIEGANFETSIVDGETSFWKCYVNRDTNFSGVGLDNCRIDPATKQLLAYNIRRKNWKEWYKEHPILQLPVSWFLSFSDYGRSTWRIIGWFLAFAFIFAALYSNLAYWLPPGAVSNFEIEAHLPLWHYFILLILRPVYFSIVTMTTLGFGDMYANSQSILGHILLTFQVIFGYVLLGALVTRFAVLFTAGGPAGKFADDRRANNSSEKMES